MKLVLAFLAGCVVTGTVLGLYINDQRYKNETYLNQSKAQLEQLSKQRDTCQAKFNKVTVLYQQPMNIFGRPIKSPVKLWAIPAEIQPAYLGLDNAGSYTHFDPRTLMETVKLPAKKATDLPAQMSAQN
jgi:hypothetical protein